MATLTEIRAAIGAHLLLIPDLVVSADLPAIQNLGDGGGAVVGGPTGDYVGAQRRGNTTWTIPIYLLAPTADMGVATRLLDELVDSFGERSVPELVWNYGRANGELGQGFGVVDSAGLCDVDAHITELVGYGVEFANAGIDHIGAVLNCVVHTPGYRT